VSPVRARVVPQALNECWGLFCYNCKTMDRIKSAPFYFKSLLAILLLAAVLLLIKGHANSFLLLNSYHNSIADFSFYYITYLGDGWFAVFLSVVLFAFPKTRKLAIVVFVAYAVSGLLAQLVKNLVEASRPSVYFTLEQYHKFVAGVDLAGAHSFPSGHTTTAFSLATVLACYTQNKKVQILYLVLAVAAGYSRIYLGQHFLTDVLVGALFGSLTAIAAVVIAEKKKAL
jgi:membrane-associated phospholipid phosphatase